MADTSAMARIWRKRRETVTRVLTNVPTEIAKYIGTFLCLEPAPGTLFPLEVLQRFAPDLFRQRSQLYSIRGASNGYRLMHGIELSHSTLGLMHGTEFSRSTLRLFVRLQPGMPDGLTEGSPLYNNRDFNHKVTDIAEITWMNRTGDELCKRPAELLFVVPDQ